VTKVRTLPIAKPPWTRCHWPTCKANPGPTLAPLCIDHLAIAHQMFSGILADLVDDSRRRNAARKPDPSRRAGGLIYFIRLGNRVKIGFTTNLAHRLSVLPHEEVLGTVPGTMKDEKRCHLAFAHLRVHGEWFRSDDDLLAFIADVTKAPAVSA
jgi:hypothetical protein